jgi:hypothetical protein
MRRRVVSIFSIINALDDRKHKAPNGKDYWRARDIQAILGYQFWQNFEAVIERAKKACESTGANPNYHFSETTKMMAVGRGAQVQCKDYYLNLGHSGLITRKNFTKFTRTYVNTFIPLLQKELVIKTGKVEPNILFTFDGKLFDKCEKFSSEIMDMFIRPAGVTGGVDMVQVGRAGS